MGKVPGILKQVIVTQIHTKNDPSDITKYEPVSHVGTFDKVLERIVHKHMFNFLRDHSVHAILQTGFIAGCSTANL